MSPGVIPRRWSVRRINPWRVGLFDFYDIYTDTLQRFVLLGWWSVAISEARPISSGPRVAYAVTWPLLAGYKRRRIVG